MVVERCEKPERLKGSPDECSPEQTQECHGDVKLHPCTTEQSCEKPEELRHGTEDCSPKQVDKCHDDVKKHPCTPKADD